MLVVRVLRMLVLLAVIVRLIVGLLGFGSTLLLTLT